MGGNAGIRVIMGKGNYCGFDELLRLMVVTGSTLVLVVVVDLIVVVRVGMVLIVRGGGS